MKKIRVKSKITKKVYDFLCISRFFCGQFFYYVKPKENQFDMGYMDNFDVIGSTWKKLLNEKS